MIRNENKAESIGVNCGALYELQLFFEVPNNAYCTGEAYTAADIMLLFGFVTMPAFDPLPIGNRAGIRGWLNRISEPETYQSAMWRAGHATDPALAEAV